MKIQVTEGITDGAKRKRDPDTITEEDIAAGEVLRILVFQIL